MVLTVPGSSSSALALSVQPTNTGIGKLDSRFAAMLTQNGVGATHMGQLGDADCTTAAIYGHIALTKEKLLLFLKRVLNLDPDTRVQDSIPVAKLVILWTACNKRTEVETESAAHRAVNRLPPQLTVDDYASAREAFERLIQRTKPNWQVPSEDYFTTKVGEIEGTWKADKLTTVTSLAQEERQRQPKGGAGTSMDFDERGVGTLRP